MTISSFNNESRSVPFFSPVPSQYFYKSILKQISDLVSFLPCI